LNRRGAWAFGVAATTSAVFARSLCAGFIDLDDPFVIVRNPHIASFSLANLRWMWGLHWAHWYPLTWMSLALDHAVWGAGPAGYHLTSIALHVLNAALVFLLVERWLAADSFAAENRRLPAAAGAALLFSLHPLRVESVSWATERSDVLAASFAFGAALFWLRGRSVVAAALHGFGLAAKSTVAPLPVVLGLLDVLGVGGRERKTPRERAVELAPMLALSTIVGLLEMAAQRRSANMLDFEYLSAFDRATLASWNYAHGVLRTLWPAGLRGLYPMPKLFDSTAPKFLAALAAVAAATLAAWFWRRRRPAFSAAWGSYLLLMAPMAGFIKTGPQLMADRYSYLAGVGFAALAGAGLASSALPRRSLRALTMLVLGLLAVATWRRQGDWLDSDRFWDSQTASDPSDALSWRFSGARAYAEGRWDVAERDLLKSAALDPASGATLNTLGLLRKSQGRLEEAVTCYRAAVAAEPGNDVGRINLASALVRLGRREEAAGILQGALARPERGGNVDDDPLITDEARSRARAMLESLRSAAPSRP
jgi:tetratricopeptide (TPR) repeat protein